MCIPLREDTRERERSEETLLDAMETKVQCVTVVKALSLSLSSFFVSVQVMV